MATSGTIYGSYSGSTIVKPYVKWSQIKYASTNKSDITCEYGIYVSTATSSNFSYNLYSHTYSYKINGTSYSTSVTFDLRNKSSGTFVKLFTKTVKGISHNTDGSKQVSITGSHKTSTSLGTGTINKTISLDPIARQSSIESITPETVEVNGSNTVTIKLKRNSTSYTHDIKLSIGSLSLTLTNVEESKTIILSTTWLNAIPNSASGIINVSVQTKNGSTNIGSPVTGSFSITVPSSAIPTVDNFTVSLYNANSVVNSWGIYVKGYSRAVLQAAASGIYGSTISSYIFSGGYAAQQVDSQYVGGIITKSGTVKFECSVKDSRGRVSSIKSKSVTVYDYASPIINDFYVERNSENAQQMIAYVSYSYSTVNGKNTAQANFYYKSKSSSSWINYGTLDNQTATTLDVIFEEDVSYDFKVVVTDALNSVELSSLVSTAKVLLDLKVGGNGFGIGKMCETDAFEVGLDSKFFAPVNISVNETNIVMDDTGIKINDDSIVLKSEMTTKKNFWDGETIELYLDYLFTFGVTVREQAFSDSQKAQVRQNIGIEDTGWQELVLNASDFKIYNNSTSNTPVYRKIGNIVQIKGIVSPVNSTNVLGTTNPVQIGTIPADCAPSVIGIYTVCHGSGNAVWLLDVTTDGVVRASRYATGETSTTPTTSAWMPFTITYFI